MKKFTLSFFLTIFIAFFSQSQTIWSSGNGSSASPFLIENTENLLYLAQNVNQGEKFSNTYFKLTNDIDLGCDENNPWLPIGDSLNTFNGHFDGDNHFITNIYINDSSHDNTYTGLFGNAYNATIHNVHLKEGSIIGQRIVGGICGNISGGTEISYCSNSCYIRGIGSVGGIAGSANSSYINRCVNTGSISAPGMSGGIVGNIFFINTTALEYCINSGYIKDMNFASAGISGQTFTDVKYCISIGSIDETRSPYAVAFKIGPVSNISNCFYDNQIISFTDAANIPGLNTAQLSGSALQNKIGQNSNWVFTDGLYPRINGIENISTSIVAATPTYLYYNGSNNYDNADNVIHDFNINTGNNVIWNSSNENSLSITGENVQVICQETVNNVTLTATKDNSKKDVMLTNKKVQTYNYDTVIICSTDLPLQYNDTLLIPAGAEDFQTDITSVNANGCTHHNITFFDITSYTTDIYVDTCNYYTWNGITYTTSNNYTQQFETGSGCDSVVTLHLTVNPTYAVTDNVTICQSELPYYYAPTDTTFQVGTPTLSIIHYPLSTIHGCDSTVTLNLTVNPTYAVTDNVTICQSELPYYYAPADTTFQVGTPALSIIHYTLSTIHGCDSVITLQLTVNEKPAAPTLTTTDNTTCSETGNGSITVTSPLGNEYEYSIDGRNYQATTSFNYLQEGSYTIYIRYTETGCSNSTTVSIGTTMTYPAANITTNSPLCEGTTLTLSGEGSASGENIAYAWAGPDNFFSTLLNPTGIENATTANAGTYTLTVTNTATNCNNTAVTTVYINENSTGTDNVTICQSELPYYYAPTDTTFQVGTPPLSIIHYPLSTIHGCDSIVTLHLTVNPTYAVTDNVTICQSELPYYYAPADTTFQVGTPPLSIIHYPLSTIHGCDSIVTLHLTVNPTYAITDNVTICQSELPYYYAPADTTFQVGTPTLSIIHYPLSTIHGCDSIVTLHLTVNPTYAITDNVTICQSELPYYYAPADTTFQVGTPTLSIIHYPLSTIHGCDSTVTLHLTVNPTYAITDNVTICQSELPYYYAPADTTFQVGTPPLSIIHYPLSTIHGCDSIVTLHLTVNYSTSSEFSQTVCDSYTWNNQTYDERGDYIQTLKTIHGCDSTVTLHLTINNSTTHQFSITTCDSHTWDGSDYTLSGDYQKTYTAANGCDSTVTLHLTINNSTTHQFSVTTCDSHTWDGSDYTLSGDYVKTYTAANDCDSTVTLHLTINNSVTHQFSVTACDSYTWDGTNYTTSGDYVKIYTAANGCDSTVTLHLTINNSTTHQFSITTCDSHTWDGSDYTLSGDYVKIYTAANGCDSTVTLHLTINNSTTHQFSVTTCDSHTWDGSDYTLSGDYVKTYTAANGCDSTVTLHLTINNSVTHQFSVTACDSYTWDGTNYTTSGDYQKTYTAANGCDSTVTLHLTINNSTTHQFSVTACDSYTWDGTNYTTSGDYVKIYTAANDCDSTVTLHLTINNSTTHQFSVTACDSHTWDGTNYTTSGDYVKIYTAANDCDSTVTLHLTINNSTTHQFSVTACDSHTWDGTNYTTSGDYVKIFTAANGCDSTITLHLTIFATPIVPICDITPNTVCSGTPDGSIMVTSPIGAEYEYSINNIDYQTDTDFNNLAAGEYNVTVRSVGTTCSNSSTIVVSSTQELPIVTASSNSPLCEGATLQLTGGEAIAGYTYEWAGANNFNNNILSPEINNITLAATGTYTLTVTGTNGCSNSNSTYVIINPTKHHEFSDTSCDEYVWNGIIYNASGDYSQTLQTDNGCDSTVTLHLTMYSTYETTDNLTICESQLPYTWNGFNFTEAGIQTVTLSTVNGCDSVVIINLTVNQSYYNEESGEICDSETYVWGNHNINIGFLTVGTHIIWDSLSTTNGCDSVYKLTLAINSTYAIIDNVTICQSELPYYYAPADTTFQVGTPPLSIIHYPLSTIHGCDSVITLQLTIDTICSELQTQIIPIVKGWSSISSYLAVNDTVTFEGVFENSGMQWVFDPTFGSGIVIIQNPYVNPSISLLVGVNSGTTPWVNKIGYTIYSNEANLSFAIEGLLLEDMQANITAGSWGLIPVLSEYAVNMTDILDDISGLDDSDIIYISSLSTSFMYAAGMVISSSLASLQPGLAYSVYSTKAFTIDYAAYGDKAVTANDSYMPATPWTTAAVNPNYHVIFADAKALHSMSDYIEIGDVVAAFSSTGLCVGQGYYNGEEGLCIKIYGDDAMTEEVDGMTAGEEISFKLYRPTTGETLDIVFEWSSEKAMFGNAAYQTKAFSKIIGVKNITGVEDCNSLNINIYPNPTTGNVYIAANANIKSISVYNSVGALVETMCTSSLQNATTIDLSRYSAGIYMLTITTEEGGSVIKKVVVSQ